MSNPVALAGVAHLYEGYEPKLLTEADLAALPSELPSGTVRYALHHGVDAILLRGKAHLARQDFARARSLLQGALEQLPDCIPLLSLLSFVLLQEDRDHTRAETMLLQILSLTPDNTQTQRNLASLRQHMTPHVA